MFLQCHEVSGRAAGGNEVLTPDAKLLHSDMKCTQATYPTSQVQSGIAKSPKSVVSVCAMGWRMASGEATVLVRGGAVIL